MSETPEKFYLTTPIYYVNARPHIGHAYTTIVADVLARRSRAQGKDTFFLTGTDEHGQKIERSAAAAAIPPQQFADQVSQEFRALWDRMGLTYDQYIRTTEDAHKRGVQRLFAELQRLGHIYLSSYTGQYCVSEEIFVEGPPGTIGPDGRPTETVTEENYFFRLSNFQLPLLDLIESDIFEIRPESRRNELLSFLRGNVNDAVAKAYDTAFWDDNSPDPEAAVRNANRSVALAQAVAEGKLKQAASGNLYVPGALRDLSISRSSFTWGIPVPGDPKHVIYVWLDALANYMTAVGYGDDTPEAQAKFARYWPADLHIVGKEITRQHCIYWPAFLLALNPALEHKPDEPMPVLRPEDHRTWAEKMLPKKVVAHGWLLFEESKMSKTRGNIVRTETILDAFGTEVYAKQFPDATKHEQDLFAADVLRYFLLREIPFGQDGSFSFDALITRYNADLANGYGNLVSRTLSLILKSSDGVVEDCIEAQTVVRFDPLVSRVIFHPELEEFGLVPECLGLAFKAVELIQSVKQLNDNQSFMTDIAAIQTYVSLVDQLMTSRKPWAATETDFSQRGRRSTLYAAAEAIRIITALLYPILPYATAQVWQQLGLGDIELAAENGQLNNLQWGGLRPGTRLGPLSPIFPRADKGLAQTMADMEQKPPPSKFVNEPFDASAHAPVDPTHPAAAPRTGTFAEPSPGLQVAGSIAETTERHGTPSHHEANPSGIFSASQTAGPADASPQISIDDFARIELRVAKVLVAERIPKADKLLRLEVDLGYEKRQILSGIAEWYTPEDLIGRRIVVITNLAPRTMRGLESHGMLLVASAPTVAGEKPGKPALATFLDADDLPLGSRLR